MLLNEPSTSAVLVSWAVAIDDCQRAGVLVSAIYAPGAGHFGHSYRFNYWGQNYASKLTEEIGGEGYYLGFTGASPDFSPYLKDAAERLNHQHLLTFLPNPGKVRFASRKVEDGASQR